jgi:hypothetical protein
LLTRGTQSRLLAKERVDRQDKLPTAVTPAALRGP